MRQLPVSNPRNPFQTAHVEYDEEHVPDAGYEILEDRTKSILSKNSSPDIGFTYSVNPYRGCLHACAYCYARPGHEYLGMGAGTDFDRKIVVKRDAPRLLREAFAKRSWQRERVVFSGVTDCYQAIEKELRLTRGCLEACVEYKTPASIISKSALVERDVDVFLELQDVAGFHIAVSIPFFDPAIARALEPYAPAPARRFHAIERLAKAGLDVSVNVAPLVPGLSESEYGRVLEAARNAGAMSAGAVLLRLPGSVAAVFEERIQVALPLRAEKILRRLREAHGGKLYRSTFGHRQRGAGNYADMMFSLFEHRCARARHEHPPRPPHESPTRGACATDERAAGSVRVACPASAAPRPARSRG